MVKKLLKVFGLLVVLGIVACAALYFLIKTGNVSLIGLSEALVAKGDVTVVNLGTRKLSARMSALDPDAEQSDRTEDIGQSEIAGFAAIPAGSYVLTLNPGGECTLSVERGDRYVFAVTSRGTAVSREGSDPTSAAELNLETSSLCR